jgi:hypothetical protein
MKLRQITAAFAAFALLAMPASSPAQRARGHVAPRDWSLLAMRTP